MPQLSLVGYHLTFDDEFSNSAAFQVSASGDTQFDDAYVFGNYLYTNNEAEYYVDPSSGIVDPFSIKNGALTITAAPTVAGEYTNNQPYTSGLLTTANSFSQNQGYFEIRCETPSAQGFWPAFWLLPEGGAGSPEIDIMEQPNLNGLDSYWTYGRPGDTADNGGSWIDSGVNLSAGYNTYGMMWTSTSITFYLNGIQVGTSIPIPPDFTEQMYLLVNLAVGGVGSWPGTPGAVTTAQLNVDYIRVYSDNPNIPAVAQQPISSPDGVNTTPVYTAPASIVVPSVTTGPDVLTLFMSEDYWLNDAQCTVSIDGVQQGGVLTVVAGNALGQSETFLFDGSFGTAVHTVSVDFLNDAYGGSAQADVNLYVLGAEINGIAIAGSVLTEDNDGAQSFTFSTIPPPLILPTVTVTPPSASTADVLTLVMAETPGLSDASFTVSVNGVQQGGILTTAALASAGSTQAFAFNGTFAAGTDIVTITFLNATGTAAADGLVLVGATIDGKAIGSSLTLTTSTPQSFNFTEPASTTVVVGSGPDTLALTVSEDAYLGNAQFTVSINGVQQGGTLTAVVTDLAPYTPLRAQSQVFDIEGSFATGPDAVTVNFLNDLYGGSTTADRNLYVLGAAINGVAVANSALNEAGGGAQSFTMVVPAPAIVAAATVASVSITPATAATQDVLTLVMAETPGVANAEFTVSVDGVQQGGIQTTTAVAAAGATQAFVVNGSFAAGAHGVSITFLNAAGTAAANGLVLQSATLDGVAIASGALSLATSTPQAFAFVEPGSTTVVEGSGPDTLALSVSEDAYLGNAQFTVSVNGVQQGGTYTAGVTDLAPYTPLLAQSQVFDIEGSFAPGAAVVTVDFLNDLYGGSTMMDRNLYVLGAAINGVAVANSALNEAGAGAQSFTMIVPTPVATAILPSVTITPASAATPDVLTLVMAETPGVANAEFTISVDGVQQGGILTTSAVANAGATQAFIVNGSFAAGAHSVSVTFLNTTGTAAADGVALQSATLDGVAIAGAALSLTTSTPQSVAFVEPGSTTVVQGNGPDMLTLTVSEDAYLGNAMFTVSVNGVQQGGTYTAGVTDLTPYTPLLAQSQVFEIEGSFAPGTAVVTVDYLNDLYGGSTTMDRNLYVLGAAINGVAVANSALNEAGAGAQSFTMTVPAPPVPTALPSITVIPASATTTDVLTLRMSEIPGAAAAQFTISVDGVQQGGIFTTAALQSLGQTQAFVVNGKFSPGANTVSVAFLNPTGSTAAQGLDLLSATLDGNAITGSTLGETSVAAQSFSFTEPSLPTTTIGSGPTTLLLGISENAYLANAQFTVSVDGVQQGGTLVAGASSTLGQSQFFAIDGNFGTGPHTVTVDLLNGLNAGTPATDRSLTVTSLSDNGVASTVGQATLTSSGTATLIANATVPLDTVTFALTEDALGGNAQVALSLDGLLLGSPSVTLLNSAGTSELFTYQGNFGGALLAQVATVNLLNDINGGTAPTDRDVYVQSITFDGAVTTMLPTHLTSNGAVNYMLPVQHTA